jgi:hypothetical protein
MNELATEEMESSEERIRQEASGCPLQTMQLRRTVLDADDELVFPKHTFVFTQYSTDESGGSRTTPLLWRERHLFRRAWALEVLGLDIVVTEAAIGISDRTAV